MWGIEIWPLADYITLETLKEYRFCYIFYPNFMPFQQVSLKISCLLLSESLHDIVESSCYIQCDHSLNLYSCQFTIIYRNMQKKISQFTIFTKVLTCFIHFALIKMRMQPIHYLINIQHWRLPFCLQLDLANCPYDGMPSIFKRGNPFFGER